MAKKDNNYYFDAFTRAMTYADQAAALLKECVIHYDINTLEEKLEQMHQIEHRGDGIKHEMMERLVKEFLPPIERGDIVELAREIDNVTDCVEDVLRRMYMYNVTAMRPDVEDFVDVVVRCCDLLNEVLQEMHNFRKSTTLYKKLIAVNAAEEEGDRLYTRAMRTLYTQERDGVEVLRWTTVYDRLEKCCDSCEHVADMIEQVILKNS